MKSVATEADNVVTFRAKPKPTPTREKLMPDDLAIAIQTAYADLLEQRGEEPDPDGKRFFRVMESDAKEFFRLFGAKLGR